ncbi:MAG: hypothetical protein GEU28_07340 [Dehalococcoidia bacterium]|nr:hypothetical protein [Dehalococcoidia bacterium]
MNLPLSLRASFVLGVVVLAIATFAAGAGNVSAGAPASLPDNDNDGIPDRWERTRTDRGLNIKALGAVPWRKDVFIEVDYARAWHRNLLTCESLDTIYDMFADAPVANPRGGPGITVHIDAGKNCPGGPRNYNYGGSRLTRLKISPLTGSCNGAAQAFSTGFDNGNQMAVMPPRRENIFHHVLFADRINPASCPGGGVLGIARAIPGRQFIVGVLPHMIFEERLVPEILGTFVHEWGHNLGLKHGGNIFPSGSFNDNPWAPNHMSVMSYIHAGGIFATANLSSPRIFDYQRLPIPALNENHLREPVGLRAFWLQAAGYKVAFFCPNGDFKISRRPANRRVDWNCDDAFGLVSANIDGQPNTFHPRTLNEWAEMVFGGSFAGGGTIGREREEVPGVPMRLQDEMTFDDRPHRDEPFDPDSDR